jgi:dATP pyrophosphohydrolase
LSSSGYKRPESVLVLVHTRTGEVLLLQRRSPPDYWQSVTGSLKAGESSIDAARRELHEETGLQLEPVDCRRVNRFAIHPAWRGRYAPDVRENTEYIFRAVLPVCRDVSLNPREHVAYRWLPAREAEALATSSTNRAAIREFLIGRS